MSKVPGIPITAFDLAQRFVGVTETPGTMSNPMVLSMLRLDNKWPEGDHVPWCSAFVNYIAFLLRLPRSKDLRARSWLRVGTPIDTLSQARIGFDVVILSRGNGLQPGAAVVDAPGHVGFFAGCEGIGPAGPPTIHLLGGNQGDAVNVQPFSSDRVIGIRRLN